MPCVFILHVTHISYIRSLIISVVTCGCVKMNWVVSLNWRHFNNVWKQPEVWTHSHKGGSLNPGRKVHSGSSLSLTQCNPGSCCCLFILPPAIHHCSDASVLLPLFHPTSTISSCRNVNRAQPNQASSLGSTQDPVSQMKLLCPADNTLLDGC